MGMVGCCLAARSGGKTLQCVQCLSLQTLVSLLYCRPEQVYYLTLKHRGTFEKSQKQKEFPELLSLDIEIVFRF